MDYLMTILSAFFTALAVQLAPMLMELAALAVTILVGHLALVARKRFGLEIEARHREALHMAIMTGLKTAVAAGYDKDQAMKVAVTYARTSVPDAVKALRPAAGVLMDIAHAKYEDVTFFRDPVAKKD